MIPVTSSSFRSPRIRGLFPALLLLCGAFWGGPSAAVAGKSTPPVAAGVPAPDESAGAQGPPLVWSPEPGVFELALARRDANPLYLPDRREIGTETLRDAKARDAEAAWKVLDAYVDLAARRSRMARLSSADRMSAAIKEIDALIREAMRVGGATYRIADGLANMRAALIAEWRKAASGNPARLAPLDGLAKRKPSTGSAARFLAQIDRKGGPIPEREVVPALLGEDPGTIRRVMKTFPADRKRALRRNASLVYGDLKREGVETEGLEPKLAAMGASF